MAGLHVEELFTDPGARFLSASAIGWDLFLQREPPIRKLRNSPLALGFCSSLAGATKHASRMLRGPWLSLAVRYQCRRYELNKSVIV
jgi:hypothetical protein